MDVDAQTAGTPSASADDFWGLMPQPSTSTSGGHSSISSTSGSLPTKPELRDIMCNLVRKVCDDSGGPLQYLARRYNTPAKVEAFAKQRYSMFPEDPAVPLTKSATCIPTVPKTEQAEAKRFFAHLAMLSFDKQASPRDETRTKTAVELTDHIMMEGFVTDVEPLILCTGGYTEIKKRAVASFFLSLGLISTRRRSNLRLQLGPPEEHGPHRHLVGEYELDVG